MAKKPNIVTVTTGYQATDTINDNFQNIRNAFDNVLSRDGSLPNFMDADLDMNGNDILNLGNTGPNAILTVANADARYVNTTGDTMTGSLNTPALYTNGLFINGQPVTPGTISYNGIVKETKVATSGQTVFNLTSITYTPGINNLSVYVDGVYQKPSNYTETDADTVTFSVGLHVGAIVDFVVLTINALPGTTDAVNVTYTPQGVGAVTTTVSAKLKEVVSVKDFGAVGDGVTDDTAAIQAAIDSGANTVYFPASGTYYFGSAVQIGSDVVLECYGANLIGAGWDSNDDIFQLTSAANVSLLGGTFGACRYVFYATAIDSFTIKDTVIDDCMIGVLVYNADSTGFFQASGNSFSNCEIGIDIQSGTIKTVDINNNRFESIAYRLATFRPAPLDKKIVSGLWYQDVLSVVGDSMVSVCSNFVDGVTGPSQAESTGDEEVHGLAVSLNKTGVVSSVIMDSNTIRNTAGYSTMVVGDEGLLGRGTHVIVSNNTLYDAGCSEGMIYAKGSDYIKVVDNIVEATASNPKLFLVRGVISDSLNGNVSGNKFIGMPIGIVTRETNANYFDNEFYGLTNFCITMRLIDGTSHVSTFIAQNYADENCGTFFLNETADGSTATYGDFIFSGNTILAKGASVSIKAAKSLVFQGNYVNRILPNTSRELIAFRANKTIDLVNICDNNIINFDDSAGTGRVLTALLDSGTGLSVVPKLIVRNNYFGTGNVGLWVRDRTYTDLVIFGNQFFCTSPLSASSITVTNYNIQTQNVGIDLV